MLEGISMIKGMLPPAVIILCVFGLEAARGQNADGAPPKNDGPASSTGWVPWERFTVAASDANMIDPVAATTGDASRLRSATPTASYGLCLL